MPLSGKDLSKSYHSVANLPPFSGFRHRLVLFGMSLASVVSGCSPLSATPPFHFHETAQVLSPGQVSISLGGGGGFLLFDGTAGGGGARMRVGVGARQEIGIEGTALYVDTDSPDMTTRPWIGRSGAYAAKLSWKGAPLLDWIAILAGAGFSRTATGTALGGDLGLLFSWGPPARVLRPYVGTRAGIGVPVGRPLDTAGGITVGVSTSAGLSIEARPWLRLFLEGTWIAGFSSISNSSDSTALGPQSFPPEFQFGLAASIGATFILNATSSPLRVAPPPAEPEEAEEPPQPAPRREACAEFILAHHITYPPFLATYGRNGSCWKGDQERANRCASQCVKMTPN